MKIYHWFREICSRLLSLLSPVYQFSLHEESTSSLVRVAAGSAASNPAVAGIKYTNEHMRREAPAHMLLLSANHTLQAAVLPA